MPHPRLTLIRVVHTVIWIFFNIVIFYMLFAAVTGRLDKWLWIGYGLIVMEGLVLALFKLHCPLTVMARKYSDSTEPNFDIYLPKWLARYNKEIYTSIMVVILGITLWQALR